MYHWGWQTENGHLVNHEERAYPKDGEINDSAMNSDRYTHELFNYISRKKKEILSFLKLI